MPERYYIVQVRGYSAEGAGRTLGTSYSVLDSAHAHREVFTRYVQEKARGASVRLEQCERECARLNALAALDG